MKCLISATTSSSSTTATALSTSTTTHASTASTASASSSSSSNVILLSLPLSLCFFCPSLQYLWWRISVFAFLHVTWPHNALMDGSRHAIASLVIHFGNLISVIIRCILQILLSARVNHVAHNKSFNCFVFWYCSSRHITS